MQSNGQRCSVHLRNTIADELLQSIKDYQSQERIYIVAVLELLGLIGPCQSSLMQLSQIKNILVDPEASDLLSNTVCCLLQQGFSGLKLLVELATKDFNSLQP